MYNEELKKRFIREYTHSVSTSKVCETTFNATEKYEIAWESDLCTKNVDELQPIVDKIVGLRARSQFTRLIVLKDYVKWCINVAKVPNACDGMLQIKGAGLEKVKQQTIPNPQALQKYLDIICDPEAMQTTDNIYRCYYWLAYAGMKEEDILNVKISDVDFSRMIVLYNDTEIPMYRESIPAFRNCCDLESFVYNHPNYLKTVWKPRANGDTLVRGVRSVTTLKSLRVELSRRAKSFADSGKTEIRLSYHRTWISGLFYRMLECERAGEKPDFTWVAEEHMKGVTYKMDSGRNTQDAKKRQLAKDYLEDYQRWKLAFGA